MAFGSGGIRSACALGVAAAFLFSGAARADRGATTIDLGTGASILFLPPPGFVTQGAPLPTTAAMGRLGVRYAFTHSLEVAVTGFLEPAVPVSHPGVVLDTSSPQFQGPDAGRGTFEGVLTHTVERHGVLVGARWLWGPVFRWTMGLDLGWSRRQYRDFDHLEVLADMRARSHQLRLPAVSRDNLVVAPIIGLEWAGGDKWSLSLLPRFEVLIGPEPLVGFSLPLIFSYALYL